MNYTVSANCVNVWIGVKESVHDILQAGETYLTSRSITVVTCCPGGCKARRHSNASSSAQYAQPCS